MNNQSWNATSEAGSFLTLYVAGACILCVTGIAGNSALLIVLLRSRKSNSMNCLLTVLTMTDILYLSASFAVIFLYDNAYLSDLPMNYTFLGAQITWICLYIVRWSQMACVWITVQISFERWLAIAKPLSGAFSVRKTKQLSAILIVGCILYEIPGCLFVEPSCTIDLECNISDIVNNTLCLIAKDNGTPCRLIRASWASYEFTVYYTSASYAILSFAIPLVSVVSFSILSLRTLRKARRRSTTLRNYRVNPGKLQHTNTTMVFMITAMFLLFEVPSLICRGIQTFGLIDYTYYTADDLYVLAAVCAIMYATVNFVVYCVCSARSCNISRGPVSLTYSTRAIVTSINPERARACLSSSLD